MDSVILISFHPAVAFRPGIEPAVAFRPGILISHKTFSTSAVLHIGQGSSAGTTISTANLADSISLAPGVLVQTVETIAPAEGPSLDLILKDSTYIWQGSNQVFLLQHLHGGLNAVLGRDPGTGLIILTTRHTVELS